MSVISFDSEISFGNGEKIALKDFFQNHYPVLCSFAAKYVLNPVMCEDIVQDVFVSFWEKQRDFANIYALKSFLYTSVRNSCLDHLKHAKIKDRYVAKNLQNDEPWESFLDDVIRKEAYQVIYSEINKLAPMGKKVLLLSLQGNSNEEIAEKLSIAINTVKTHKARAYKILRTNLADLILFFSPFNILYKAVESEYFI